jgi:hypothetical protein
LVLNPTSLKNRYHQIDLVAACDRARSSASVLDFVTNFYFIDRQLIGPPNKVNRYPSMLFLLTKLSLNDASLALAKIWFITFSSKYLITRVLV